jgi:hypothetical protein
MTTFLLVLMALLLIAALERNHRRQPPTPPGPSGTRDQDDRDWARIQLDLLALGTQPRWTGSNHNDPRPR